MARYTITFTIETRQHADGSALLDAAVEAAPELIAQLAAVGIGARNLDDGTSPSVAGACNPTLDVGVAS
jgi:hypothetical protein